MKWYKNISNTIVTRLMRTRIISYWNKNFILNIFWTYGLSVHSDSVKQIEGKRKRRELHYHQYKERGVHHYFEYSNNVRLNNSSEVRCNYLRYTKTDKKGKKTTFTWVTNITINKSRLSPIMKVGRSRWKIENETFNTLKNLGYHFGHNFGHGKDHLSTMFAYLMLLAFYVDQFVQSQCHTFKVIEKGIYAKKKLWESMKSIFHALKCKSMDFIYRTIADLFELQLE